MTYHITISSSGYTLTVRADGPESAAGIAVRRLYGRAVTAQRVTGDTGKSGIFAAYRYDRRLSAACRIGSDLHVA